MAAASITPRTQPFPLPSVNSQPSRPPSRPSSRLLPSPPLSSAPPAARAPLVWRKRVPLSFAQPPQPASAYLSSTGRVIASKREDKPSTQSVADRRRATSAAARSRVRDRNKAAAAVARKDSSAVIAQRGSEERWTDREGWRVTEDEVEDGEERIEQEDSATTRQPSALTAMLLTYPRPMPPLPPQSVSPLLSASLLSLTMRYWQTFLPPLTPGCCLPRAAYLHLRLLTLRSALLSASHGHLSLRSRALLSHLDWYEDSAEQVEEEDDEAEREAASNGMRLPVFHRALLAWAMLHLGVNERSANVEQLEQCMLTLYQQVTHEPPNTDESKEGESSNDQTRRYLPLTADDEFVLREVAEDAKLQWQRATAEHDKRKRRADDDSHPGAVPNPAYTTAAIVQRLEEHKEALALQHAMPPLLAGAVNVIVRRYPSGSEIRQQARMSADRPSRVNSRERPAGSPPSYSPHSSSFSASGAAGFDPFSLSAPLSLSPVKLTRHRSSASAVSPAPSRSPTAAAVGKGGRSQLSQSPPPGLSSYGQKQSQWPPNALSLTPTARGDLSTSFAAMSLRISPMARPANSSKRK